MAFVNLCCLFLVLYWPPAGATAADGGVGLGEDGGVGGQGVEVGGADHGVTQGPHLGEAGGSKGWLSFGSQGNCEGSYLAETKLGMCHCWSFY